ncbi:MAG: hypothetical protein RSF41_08105 [Lachnospiraceae bacterium]
MSRKTNTSHSHSKEKSTLIIGIIVAFVLSILLTLLTTMLAVYLGLFNTNSVIVSFNKVDYYHNVLEDFDKKAWDITIPLGLPKEVVTDLVEINKVSRDVKGSLMAGLDHTDYIPDTTDIEQDIDDRVRQYFADQGKALDANQEKVLAEYKTTIAKDYLKSVEIPLIKYFGNLKNLYQKVMTAGIPICLILSFVAITMIIKIQKWKHRGLRVIAYSTLAAMVMTGLVPGIILISGIYKRLDLAPKYFYHFIMEYIKGGLQTFIYFSIVWFLVSVVLMLVCNNMKKKLIHKSYKGSRK